MYTPSDTRNTPILQCVIHPLKIHTPLYYYFGIWFHEGGGGALLQATDLNSFSAEYKNKVTFLKNLNMLSL